MSVAEIIVLCVCGLIVVTSIVFVILLKVKHKGGDDDLIDPAIYIKQDKGKINAKAPEVINEEHTFSYSQESFKSNQSIKNLVHHTDDEEDESTFDSTNQNSSFNSDEDIFAQLSQSNNDSYDNDDNLTLPEKVRKLDPKIKAIIFASLFDRKY
jgi:hypothetical protein